MEKPYTVLYNAGNAEVLIDKRVATNVGPMIERFIADGYTQGDVTESDYKEIIKARNFM